MGFSLNAADVAAYASRPFVQLALAHPYSPKSVLSFYLGVDYSTQTNEMEDELRSGSFLRKMSPFWYGGHQDFDKLCQNSFQDLVRAAGKKELKGEWESSVDGQLAMLILCDQISRNAFRGLDEAFAYDATALDISYLMASKVIFPEAQSSEPDKLEGIFYPCYSTFIITSLMHSEVPKDHELAAEVLEWATVQTPPALKDDWWSLQKDSLHDHSIVLNRFGRYPHRNAKKLRENTKEEEAWLSNVDELPGWVKSQL